MCPQTTSVSPAPPTEGSAPRFLQSHAHAETCLCRSLEAQLGHLANSRHGDQRPCVVHCNELPRRLHDLTFLLAASSRMTIPGLFPFCPFVISFNAHSKLSHAPSGAPHAGTTICSCIFVKSAGHDVLEACPVTSFSSSRTQSSAPLCHLLKYQRRSANKAQMPRWRPGNEKILLQPLKRYKFLLSARAE